MKQAYEFLFCLVALMLGIFFESFSPMGMTANLWFFVAACCITLLCWMKFNQKIRFLACLLFCLVTGQLILATHTQILKQNQKALSGRYRYLAGIVTDKQQLKHPLFKENFVVALESGKHDKFFVGQRLHSSVMVYSRTSTTTAIGDKILLRNVSIKPPEEQLTENDLSLAKQGTAATIFTATNYQCKVVEKESSSLRAKIWHWRQTIYTNITKHLSPLTSAYVGLLFFGNKQHDATSTLHDIFARWGLSHYLARAGLHIVLLIGMWFVLLQLLPFHARIKNLFLCGFIITYSFCSWESTSYLRALFAFLAAQCGRLLGREIKTLHLLTLICMGMILYNPFLIFYLDFQLTFGLTFGLIIFSKHLTA